MQKATPHLRKALRRVVRATLNYCKRVSSPRRGLRALGGGEDNRVSGTTSEDYVRSRWRQALGRMGR